MATSYSNYGGSGNRPHVIKGSTNISLSWGDVNGLLNGAYTNDMRFSDAQDVTGKYIQFEFIESVVIDEAKWYQDGASANGTWKWQGSNNGSNWNDIGSSFVLGGVLTQTQTQLNGNTLKYKYYRLFGVSGTTLINDYVREIEFKIGANARTYLSGYGFNDRRSRITATQNAMAGSGTTLVDGLNGSTLYFNIGDVTGRYIKFDLGVSVQVIEAVWIQSTTAVHGTWKWQGSNNDADWTDIGYSFTLGGATEQIQIALNSNTSSYRYYQLLGVSGTASASPYIYETLFKILKTVSSPTNNFTDDADCKAVWRFENDLTDIIGRNTLGAGGGGVSYTSSSPLEGTYSLDNEYDSNQGALRTDANLSTGFPFKNGDTIKKGTILVRLKPESHYAKRLAIWMKSYYYSASTSNSIGLASDNNQLTVCWGDGSVNQWYNTGINMVDGQNYHVAVAIDGIAPSLYVRVYDYTAAQVFTYSTTPANELPIHACDFDVCRFSDAPSSQNWDGLLDELVVFNRVLSDNEIDLIRLGEYGEGYDDNLVGGVGAYAIQEPHGIGTVSPYLLEGQRSISSVSAYVIEGRRGIGGVGVYAFGNLTFGTPFSGPLTDISGQRYYVRAYAITADGTSYSDNLAFDGFVCYEGPLTDLDENSTYHVRAYVINEGGVAYSDDVPFNVPPCPMDVIGTLNATLAPVSARSGSYIISPSQYDCDLMALWGFDSNALMFDSVGNNDLTAFNSPTADQTNFQVGDASLALNGTNWASILDNNLDENFPLKLGDPNKVMTITSWFSNFTTSEQTLFAKAGDNGLSLRIFTLYNQLIVEWGYNRGEVKETFYYPRQIKIDQWYHLLLSVDGIRRRLVISLYNLSTKGQNICEFRPSNELAIGTFPIYLGAAPGGYHWNGRIDETRIFNCILPPEAQLRLVYNLYDTINPALPKPSPLPDKSGWKWNEMFWR